MSLFRYSRWDGTQQVLPFDADAIMDAISEDVIAHGDVRRALEKLMQQGHRFQSGERMPGIKDLIERLKQRRQETLRRNNMDGIIKDIQQRLEKVKETERAGIQKRVSEGQRQLDEASAKDEGPKTKDGGDDTQPSNLTPQSSEERAAMQRMLEKMAQRRMEQLDELPKDIGGQIKALRDYDFMEPEARRQCLGQRVTISSIASCSSRGTAR